MEKLAHYLSSPIVGVKLVQIDPSPHYQMRLPRPLLRNLDNLRDQGQRDPVHLQRKSGKMRILDGHDRVECARALGWSEIGALVHDVDDQQARRLAWELNAWRADFTGLERLNAIEIFVEAGLSNAQIAPIIGFKHEKSVSRLRGSLPLSRRYWALLREGKLRPNHIRALRRVPRAKWDAFVKKALDEGLSGSALARAIRPRREVLVERAGGAFTVWTYVHDPERTDAAAEVERHAEQLDHAADQLRIWCRRRRREERSPKPAK